MAWVLRVVTVGMLLWVASIHSFASPDETSAADWRHVYARPASGPYPADDPWSAAKAELGAALFYDPILSGSHSISCESCHQPSVGWADHLALSLGDRHEPMALRSPTLIGVARAPALGWDGKFEDIETVALRAITTPGNMNLPITEALERLAANPAYVQRFRLVFGQDGITEAHLLQALATYVRSITTPEAPFDRWIAGDAAAVSEGAKRGFALFTGKAGCSNCHSGPDFTDYSFQDIGIGVGDDIGRGRMFPTSKLLRYAFKVPSLRDVAVRAPYMHNGSLPTLAAVIDHYDRGGIDRTSRSPSIRPLGLTATEKADLVDFLETLTADSGTVIVPFPPH